MFALNSNPRATYGSSLLRRIASSRAFVILLRQKQQPALRRARCCCHAEAEARSQATPNFIHPPESA
jgi:hypothetical protein